MGYCVVTTVGVLAGDGSDHGYLVPQGTRVRASEESLRASSAGFAPLPCRRVDGGSKPSLSSPLSDVGPSLWSRSWAGPGFCAAVRVGGAGAHGADLQGGWLVPPDSPFGLVGPLSPGMAVAAAGDFWPLTLLCCVFGVS